MDLYKEILLRILEKEEVQIVFPNLSIKVEEIVRQESYQALQIIKAILEDDSLNDPECFQRIEAVICLFERLGSGGGGRHDFG